MDWDRVPSCGQLFTAGVCLPINVLIQRRAAAPHVAICKPTSGVTATGFLLWQFSLKLERPSDKDLAAAAQSMMFKSLVTGAVILSFLKTAGATCTDCDSSEESVLLQQKESLNDRHALADGEGHRGPTCEQEVDATQKAWKDAILSISESYLVDGPEGDYVQLAEHAIHDLYGYDVKNVNVMFKPTQAAQDPFRPTAVGALSYFVGYEATKDIGGFEEDKGFAIAAGEGWKKILFFNDQVRCVDNLAFAQGYYYFTNAKTGAIVGVEYSFTYKLLEGNWKIIVHHSSLPFPVSAPTGAGSLLQDAQEMEFSKAWLKDHVGTHRHKAVCDAEVDATQKAWKDAILSISESYLVDGPEGDYVQLAEHAIHDLYAYSARKVSVMFKPTQAAQDPFRPTAIGALSYFVGYEATKDIGGFEEDKGFAIAAGEGWKKILFFNDQVSCIGNIALAQGYYYFTNAKTGAIVGVEYSFGYQLIKGKWKIFLHHSSVPFPVAAPGEMQEMTH